MIDKYPYTWNNNGKHETVYIETLLEHGAIVMNYNPVTHYKKYIYVSYKHILFDSGENLAGVIEFYKSLCE